ncbi:MAG: SH3 domain-containing protein [Aggregatilineales bacterium]
MNHTALFVILLLAALFGAACQTATPSPTALPPTDTAEPTEAPTATPTTVPTETPLPAEDDDPFDETAELQEQVETASTVDGETFVRVGTQSTNARSGPGTTFAVVRSVAALEELPVIARTDETRPWYLVVLPDGTQGWVSSRAVTLVPEDADVPIAEDIPAAP